MKQLSSERLTHDGVTFELRVMMDDVGYQVFVIAGGRTLGRYSVALETAADFAIYLGSWSGLNPVEELVKIAKNDIVAGHLMPPQP